MALFVIDFSTERENEMRILFIGDIVGRPGRSALENRLSLIEEENQIDFTIANAENASGGFGIDKRCFDQLHMSGIDAFTMGNHTFDNRGILEFIDHEPKLVRPANLPKDAPGRGHAQFTLKDGRKLTIINILGRVYNNSNIACPFTTMDELLHQYKMRDSAIIVDFHGDATSEKVCLGRYLDGRVTAVLGTHTHIQTADARILPRGAGYITDVGMTGAYQSCLGMETEGAVGRFTKTLTKKLTPAKGERQLNAVILEIDEENKTQMIQRLFYIWPEENKFE